MSECRRHILASHLCPARVLGGDRLELVMDRARVLRGHLSFRPAESFGDSSAEPR